VNGLQSVCTREIDWIRQLVTALVSYDSPSTDRTALDRCGDYLATRLSDAGASVSRLAAGSTTDHVLARWPGGGPSVLLVGHFDTVWPVGQQARMPIIESDGKLFGPGVLDMKAGLGIAALAARALAEVVPEPRRPQVTLVATSDEEVGSRTSRAAIERLASDSVAVLVLEPALPGGAVKTARKGVGEFVVEVRGISAHAGANPGAGASAVHELARIITAIEGWNDPSRGITVNVGVVDGGLRSNVVADHARAVVDVRIVRQADAASIEAAFAALAPTNPRVQIQVAGSITRPPMERTAGVAKLYELAREVARSHGTDLAEGATGGASDGNFTAALGIPTLDGLGATGDGPHALDEHVIVKDLPERAALVAGLMARLDDMR
jgi:glutamate carboxypeptidase